MNVTDNDGLLTDSDSGHCIGYLFEFTERGIYSPTGKVDVTKEQMEKHNELLARAEIEGLDNNCKVGQGGTFYFTLKKGVTTWNGKKVADYTLNGKVITFTRAGKVFRGRLQKDADCFNFKRIS